MPRIMTMCTGSFNLDYAEPCARYRLPIPSAAAHYGPRDRGPVWPTFAGAVPSIPGMVGTPHYFVEWRIQPGSGRPRGPASSRGTRRRPIRSPFLMVGGQRGSLCRGRFSGPAVRPGTRVRRRRTESRWHAFLPPVPLPYVMLVCARHRQPVPLSSSARSSF